MGRIGGHLRSWQRSICLCAGLVTVPLLAAPAATAAEPDKQPASPSQPLSAEDAELLRNLDLLLQLEFLSNWDPAEDLPIPLEDEPEPADRAGEAGR